MKPLCNLCGGARFIFGTIRRVVVPTEAGPCVVLREKHIDCRTIFKRGTSSYPHRNRINPSSAALIIRNIDKLVVEFSYFRLENKTKNETRTSP